MAKRFFESTIIDNTNNLKMADLLSEMLDPDEHDECMIATGFWDIPGMALIYPALSRFLEAGKSIRLIIGTTPEVKAYQLEKGFEPGSHPEKTIAQSLEDLSEKLKDEYKDVIKLLMNYSKEDENNNRRLHIKKFGKSLKDQFLHAKCYIVRRKKTEYRVGCARGVIGSSNFTYNGLTQNAELNYFEHDSHSVNAEPGEYSNIKGHIHWFEDIWNSELSEDWNETFIEILKKSKPGKTVDKEIHDLSLVTPYEAYIRILHEEYGSLLDANVANIIRKYLPESYRYFDYQIQGVQWCAHIMQHFNGFILSDVVGLGKTVVGVLLAKYYVEQIAPQSGREKNILIIAPPTILKDWEQTIEDFDNNRDDKLRTWVKPMSIGCINKAELSLDEEDFNDIDIDNDESGGYELEEYEKYKQQKYGLILVDESHRFRHSNTEMYKSLESLIDAHDEKPYIGLISATPQNNEPWDLYNQIKLFERMPTNSHFEKVDTCNIHSFFKIMRDRYNDLKTAQTEKMTEEQKDQNKQALIDLSSEIRDKVLYDIMVRRTRSDIVKYYSSELHFPKVNGPNNIKYHMSPKLTKLFDDTVSILIGTSGDDSENVTINQQQSIGYYRYCATQFLKKEHQKHYESGSATVENTSKRLAKIMKILLIKRLESSIEAFKESLNNLKEYTQNMIEMWNHKSIFICPDIDVNSVFRKVYEDARHSGQWVNVFEQVKNELNKKISKLSKTKQNKNREYIVDDFDEAKDYYQCLMSDIRKIDDLCSRWSEIRIDPKIVAFSNQFNELFDPVKNKPQKLVIFTEAIRTAEYIQDYVELFGKRGLIITAEKSKNMRQVIRENFDANYPKEQQKNDYDVIITTDILAEGINLHRANTILNYDTPWNATRLIQRIGRVNRIGSEEPVVYVYNFYPSDQGNAEINLKQNAFAKLQAFHAQFGGDNKVYSDAEVIPEADYNHWMDEVDGGESPVQKHIRNLKAFIDKEPIRYEALCQMKCDIVTGYEINDNESYHIIKTSPNASGCFAVKSSGDKRIHIPVLELLDHIECDPNTPRTERIQDFDIKAVLDVYRNSKNKHQKQKETEDDISAKAIIDLWRTNYQLSEEINRKLNVLYEMIEGGDHSITKKIIQFQSELGQRDLMMTDEARIVNWVAKLAPNVQKDILFDKTAPYLLASIVHTKHLDNPEAKE